MKRIEAKAGERSSSLRDMVVFLLFVSRKKGTPRRRSFKGLIDFWSVEVATPYKHYKHDFLYQRGSDHFIESLKRLQMQAFILP